MEVIIYILLVVLFLWVTSGFDSTSSEKKDPTKTGKVIDGMVGGIKIIIFLFFIVLGIIAAALSL